MFTVSFKCHEGLVYLVHRGVLSVCSISPCWMHKLIAFHGRSMVLGVWAKYVMV